MVPQTFPTLSPTLTSAIAGKTILVTGPSPNSIAAHFAHTIARYHPRLLILCGRSPKKVQETADAILVDPECKGVKVVIVKLDLADLDSTRAAARQVEEVLKDEADRGKKIDVMVNSAGIMAHPHHTLTPSHHELQLATNHLGHFLLTSLLLPYLLPSRIINISSNGHKLSPIRFSDINFTAPLVDQKSAYNPWTAYGQSKTANILFSKSLAVKYGNRGVRAYSLHPGVVLGTGLAGEQGLGEEMIAGLLEKCREVGWENDLETEMRSVGEAVEGMVVAAFGEGLENGAYLVDGKVSGDVWAYATDLEEAEKLWVVSEDMVGQRFE